MAISPIYESLKIKNLQTAKEYKMPSSRVFRQSRKKDSDIRAISDPAFDYDLSFKTFSNKLKTIIKKGKAAYALSQTA